MTGIMLGALMLNKQKIEPTIELFLVTKFSQVKDVAADWDSNSIFITRHLAGSDKLTLQVVGKENGLTSVTLENGERLLGISSRGKALIGKIESKRDVNREGDSQPHTFAQYEIVNLHGLSVQQFSRKTVFWEYGYEFKGIHTLPFRTSRLSRFQNTVATIESVRPPSISYSQPRISDQKLWAGNLDSSKSLFSGVSLKTHEKNRSFQCISWGMISESKILTIGGWLRHEERLIEGFNGELCFIVFDCFSGFIEKKITFLAVNDHDRVELYTFGKGEWVAVVIGETMTLFEVRKVL